MRIALGLLLVLAPATAAAHIQLNAPTTRTTSQKVGPCGVTGSVRGANVTVLEPGASLMVLWAETINHPGHYRVSFDPDGQDFTVPLSFTDTTQTENVLVDSIADGQGGSYMQMVQLPNMACENCTLQLIQMMTDKPPYGDGNDIYFQCADIALRPGGGPPDAGSVGGADGGLGGEPGDINGGCSTGGPPGGLVALGAAALLLRRRRARASR